MLRNILIRIATIAVGIIIGLVVAELCLAFFLPQKVTTTYYYQNAADNFEPTIGWTDYKNSSYRVRSSEYDVNVMTNTLGFRDDEWTSTTGTVALGDSFTQAIGVKKEQRFTELLGMKNTGVGGYSTCNEYLVLKSLPQLPSRTVLFFYTGNDFNENIDGAPRRPVCTFDIGGNFQDVTQPKNIVVSKSLTNRLILETNLGSLVMNKLRFSPIVFTVSKWFGIKSDYAAVHLFEKSRRAENEILFAKTYPIIKGIDKLTGHKLTVVIIPQRIQVDTAVWDSIAKKYGYNQNDYDMTMPNRELDAYLEKQGIPFVDLYDYLKTYNNLYYPSDGHLNAEGHKKVAEVLQQLWA